MIIKIRSIQADMRLILTRILPVFVLSHLQASIPFYGYQFFYQLI